MDSKTPLQAIVLVICDCLHDLSPEDQARALEAARVTLGLRVSQAPQAPQDMNPYQEVTSRPPLPRIEVQMMGDRPVVMNPTTEQPGQRLVVSGPRRITVIEPRQFPAASDLGTDSPQAARGYVNKIR